MLRKKTGISHGIVQNIRETLNPNLSEYLANSWFNSVDFPEPEGPENTRIGGYLVSFEGEAPARLAVMEKERLGRENARELRNIAERVEGAMAEEKAEGEE